jgi:hypothetical protein
LRRAKLGYAILRPVELRDGKGHLTGKLAPTNIQGAKLADADLAFVDLSQALADPGVADSHHEVGHTPREPAKAAAATTGRTPREHGPHAVEAPAPKRADPMPARRAVH